MDTRLFPAERAFRAWMLVSALMFGFAVPLFFFAGVFIVPVINFISSHLCSLPLYPLPANGMEGAFWRVLAVSMMAMLTWACWKIYLDVRRYNHLTPIILISKCCSTSLYLLLFLSDHYLACLVGALTDGPIFLLTWLLWYLARPAGQIMDRREEDILAAVGDALVPHGGPYGIGFQDVQRESLADVRRSLGALSPLSQIGARLMIRMLNAAPVLTAMRWGTLLGIPRADRAVLLERLERHPVWIVRGWVMAVKTFVIMAFFNQPEVSAAVGFDPKARIRS